MPNRQSKLWGGGQAADPVPCFACDAPDCRDTRHQAGCPSLPPVLREELARLAQLVEDGWIADRERVVATKGAGA
jgi:hypothetical protein